MGPVMIAQETDINGIVLRIVEVGWLSFTRPTEFVRPTVVILLCRCPVVVGFVQASFVPPFGCCYFD